MRKLWLFGALLTLSLAATACNGSDMGRMDDHRAYTTWDGDGQSWGAHDDKGYRDDERIGTSFEQMLENAKVHDRDGRLLDGENSRS